MKWLSLNPGMGAGLPALLMAVLLLSGLLGVAGCGARPAPVPPPGHPKPYRIGKDWHQPLPHADGFREKGVASWYGGKFHGRRTANGEVYDMHAMTAAHKTLPFGTLLLVKNLANQRQVEVRVNDRGPFVRGRIIDLSYAAARELGIVGPGTAPVEVVAVQRPAKEGTAPDLGTGAFTVQVGAFQSRANAEKLRRKLAAEFENAHIVDYLNGATRLYRVRVGSCATLSEAYAQERILMESGYEEAFAVAE